MEPLFLWNVWRAFEGSDISSSRAYMGLNKSFIIISVKFSAFFSGLGRRTRTSLFMRVAAQTRQVIGCRYLIRRWIQFCQSCGTVSSSEETCRCCGGDIKRTESRSWHGCATQRWSRSGARLRQDERTTESFSSTTCCTAWRTCSASSLWERMSPAVSTMSSNPGRGATTASSMTVGSPETRTAGRLASSPRISSARTNNRAFRADYPSQHRAAGTECSLRLQSPSTMASSSDPESRASATPASAPWSAKTSGHTTRPDSRSTHTCS
mmetsp:Transcript_25028/g.43216  ORF Transcript_25028/g.43216 Transcript_25028/m.43216 type:complete len:267 (+) Transcript_25028:289-1089(+)